METVVIRVYGSVQGVGFRYFTKRLADKIGSIGGMVRNEMDGSVYIEANGTKEQLEKLVEGVQKPLAPSGYVERVEVKYNVAIEIRKHFVIEGYGYA